MKTRAKGAAKAADTTEPAKSITPKAPLGPESSNPPRLFILPEDATPEARIVTLTNPRYASEDRYMICPIRGIYEFTRIAAPKMTPRSWLLAPEVSQDNSVSETGSQTKPEANPKGFISKEADLFIATSIDALFFLLPALNPPSKSSEPAKKLFLSGDDYLEKITTTSPQLSTFLRTGCLRESLEWRLKAVCETVDAGDETMYRLSEDKLLEELLQKARRMVAKGLPASMEENLVRKALEAPMLSIKREDTSPLELAKEDESTRADSADTQTTVSTTDSAATSFSEPSTAATSFSQDSSAATTHKRESAVTPANAAPEGVAEMLRLRTALFFICSNYLRPYISEGLKKVLKSPGSPVDFTQLDTHLIHLAKLRKDALAARSMSDYSRKRGMDEDDETIEIRAEKKRKKDEEEKRKKAGMSMGVKKLQKANTTGMKKMSDFFKKKT